MGKSDDIRLEIANSIIQKLWIMGLLKDDERVKLFKRNKESFIKVS